MNDLERDCAGAAAAHRSVVAALWELTDEQVARESLLPGWTVGHVATHIARNAEGLQRMIEAAMRSEVGEMYPGGSGQRTSDIEAGAHRPAEQLAADVRDTAASLESAWAAMTDEAWAGRGRTRTAELAIRDVPFIRWREVAVHHADFGIGYSWSDWDGEYARLELSRLTMLWASRKPMGLTTLPAPALAVATRHRVAWLLGRAEIEGLDPAGIID